MEFALLSPWIFFLFVGAFDMGFYCYALIATQNAARIGAEWTSKSPTKATDQASACAYAKQELWAMSNVRSLTSWPCNALPLLVTAELVDPGPDGAKASRVSVQYQTDQLIPIPGLLAGSYRFTRKVQMRVK